MTRRVAVVRGGWVAEKGISLVSGTAAEKALRGKGYEVEAVEMTRRLAEDLRASFDARGPEVVFNALHGPYGEDGTVQGLLEIMGIPYTHSGVLASAVCMDKPRAKAMMRAAGLPVPDGFVVPIQSLDGSHPMKPPYVVKPVGDGSSFGVTIIDRTANAGPRAELMDERLFGGVAMVEPFVGTRELTVTCMNDRALCVTEIVPAAGFYDYAAKYQEGGSIHVLPAHIPAEVTEEARRVSSEAVRALGCKGVSRTDLRWDEEAGVNGLFILEVNTQPGLTPTSLSPEQAAHEGMSFGDLVAWMVEDASCPR